MVYFLIFYVVVCLLHLAVTAGAMKRCQVDAGDVLSARQIG